MSIVGAGLVPAFAHAIMIFISKNSDRVFRIVIWTGIVLVLVGFLFFVVKLRTMPSKSVRFGITYSTTYAQSLGLDVKKTYADIIENLGVRFVRLPVYWSEIEPKKNTYEWSQLDDMVHYSESHNVKLTLVVGSKVPRWPECYVPNWAQPLSEPDQQTETLKMIQSVVDRYKSSTAVERWQVENEPFFPFGICQQISKKDLIEQIDLVRRLDTRPIQLTAGGEIEPWRAVAERADILGISMYRKTWNKTLGYFEYPLSPEFYLLRAKLIGDLQKKVIISELQAEPWFSKSIKEESLEHWYQAFSAEDFQNNIDYAKASHLDEAYLWGAEWWEYARLKGDDRLWNVAKEVFSNK